MRKYRLTLLLKSGIKKEAKAKLLDDVKKIIGEVKDEQWKELGDAKLAYPVKKEKMGEYIVLNFSAEKLAQDIDKRIGIKEDVLRYLLIRQK